MSERAKEKLTALRAALRTEREDWPIIEWPAGRQLRQPSKEKVAREREQARVPGIEYHQRP